MPSWGDLPRYAAADEQQVRVDVTADLRLGHRTPHLRRVIADVGVDVADVGAVPGERYAQRLCPSTSSSTTNESDGDEDELHEVGVGDRVEAADERVEDGEGGAHHNRPGLVEVQYQVDGRT